MRRRQNNFAANKVATCSLPEIIGRPPLRNAVARGETAIVDQKVKVIQLPSIPEPTIVEPTFVPTFDGVPLLLRWEGGTLRGEPFSDLPWHEWDLLIGAGRLGAVDLDAAKLRLEALSRGRADRELLLIALAYAARVQQHWDQLENFLLMLTPSSSEIPDVKLLHLEQDNKRTEVKLHPPLFRWGIDLVGHRAPKTGLPGVPVSSSIWSVFEVAEKNNATANSSSSTDADW